MKPNPLWMCLALLTGCVSAPFLVPDRGATLVGGNAGLAYADVAGIRVVVDGHAWRSDPLSLPELMTPVQVTIENHGDQHLRLSYSEISLISASGFRYPALAPMSGQPPVSQLGPEGALIVPVDFHPRPPRFHPLPPRFAHHRFLIAPHFYYLYPGFVAWSLAFPWDSGYYQRYYGNWPERLPTADMLAEALPEGVVEDGGHVTGFLYFQSVAHESQVRFELKLVNATTNEPMGVVSIPLAVLER